MSVAVALGLTFCLPGLATAAAPVVHLHDVVEETGVFSDCGFPIRSEFSAAVHILVREAPNGGGEAFLGGENVRFEEILTNPATGAWFVNRGSATFKELAARHLGGTLWEFTAHDVGTRVFANSDGKVVLRDSGRIEIRAVFDTLGDGRPGGIKLVEEITGVHGSFPGIDVDTCDIATDLIGNTNG